MAEFGLRRYFFLSRRPRCNAKEMAEQNSKCRKTEFKVDLIKNYLHCHIVISELLRVIDSYSIVYTLR